MVKVLYACESGSRAWGFASTDSDWNIRFIYIHPFEWYLSVDLESKRDVIELPITDNLDFSGWDLRKALKLFYKSKPPLIEWLHSPIVYQDRATWPTSCGYCLENFTHPAPVFTITCTWQRATTGNISRAKQYG